MIRHDIDYNHAQFIALLRRNNFYKRDALETKRVCAFLHISYRTLKRYLDKQARVPCLIIDYLELNAARLPLSLRDKIRLTPDGTLHFLTLNETLHIDNLKSFFDMQKREFNKRTTNDINKTVLHNLQNIRQIKREHETLSNIAQQLLNFVEKSPAFKYTDNIPNEQKRALVEQAKQQNEHGIARILNAYL